MKFNKRKQIFQANAETLEKYPYYRGFFMSSEWFQQAVVYLVWYGYQAREEKFVGNTIYKNGIGFAKGKVAETLSAISMKIYSNIPIDKKDKSNLRSYGMRYVPQFLQLAQIYKSAMANFLSEYQKYASECDDLLSGIYAMVNDSSTTEVIRESLLREANKIKTISKASTIRSNVEKIKFEMMQKELF